MPATRGANVYLLTEGPLTLIDSGLAGSASAVIEFMAALGYRPTALERILLTHRHPDHSGAAGTLREATGARIHAHAGDVDFSAEGAFVRGLYSGAAPVDSVLEGDEVLEGGVRVLHCGGHTAGSVAYYLEARRALFLGDMAINNVDRLSRPIAFSSGDSAQYEEALARLAGLDAVAGFFGHGPPLFEGTREALLALVERGRTPAWRGVLRYALLRLRRPRRRD